MFEKYYASQNNAEQKRIEQLTAKIQNKLTHQTRFYTSSWGQTQSSNKILTYIEHKLK